MRSCFASLGVLYLIAGALLAQQDGVIKNFTPADFETFLKQDLKKKFDKREKDDSFLYIVKDSFRAEFQVKDKALVLYEQFKYELPQGGKAGNAKMAAKVKQWNDKAKYSRAEVRGSSPYGGSSLHTVKFSGTLDLSEGVSRKKVSDFYVKLDKEFDDWVIYMQDLLKHDKDMKKKNTPKQGAAKADGLSKDYPTSSARETDQGTMRTGGPWIRPRLVQSQLQPGNATCGNGSGGIHSFDCWTISN